MVVSETLGFMLCAFIRVKGLKNKTINMVNFFYWWGWNEDFIIGN